MEKDQPTLLKFEGAFIREKKAEFAGAFDGLLAQWVKGECEEAFYKYALTENWQAEAMLFFIMWEDFARKHHHEMGFTDEMGIYEQEESVMGHELKHLIKAHTLGIPMDECFAQIDLQRVPDEQTRSMHSCNVIFPQTSHENTFQIMLAPEAPSFVDTYTAAWSLLLLDGDTRNIPQATLDKWEQLLNKPNDQEQI